MQKKITGNQVEIKLSQLTDVNLSGVSTNDVLKWNGTTWVSGPSSGGPGAALRVVDNAGIVDPETPTEPGEPGGPGGDEDIGAYDNVTLLALGDGFRVRDYVDVGSGNLALQVTANQHNPFIMVPNTLPPIQDYTWSPDYFSDGVPATYSSDRSTATIIHSFTGSTNFGERTVRTILPGSKTYCEFVMTAQSSNNNYHAFGLIKSTVSSGAAFYNLDTYTMFSRAPNTTAGCGLPLHGFTNNGTVVSDAAYSFQVNSIIGIAVDMSTGKVWFSKNGNWISGDPAADTGETLILPNTVDEYAFTFLSYSCGVTSTMAVQAVIYPNSSDMIYDPPTGFQTFYGY